MSAVKPVLLFLCVAVGQTAVTSLENELTKSVRKAVTCITEGCVAGEECVIVDDVATCVCRKSCKPNKNAVCGSDGQTYPNHCDLHRTACIEKRAIHINHDGFCDSNKEQKDRSGDVDMKGRIDTTETRPFPREGKRPLVCYKIEREELRRLLIDWLKSGVQADGWFSRGKSYNDIVMDTFSSCDEDGDRLVNADEFLQCTEKNDTIRSSHESLGSDAHILRGLCIDALIGLVDEDNDWQLDIHEFTQSMDPGYSPPKRDCELENRKYEDGFETTVGCNICVCACGNWVCTGSPCDAGEQNIRPGMTIKGRQPSRRDRLDLLRGFQASSKVSPETVDEEVTGLRDRKRTKDFVKNVKESANTGRQHLRNDEV